MTLRSLAFQATTATNKPSGLSLLHAACLEDDLETVQIITNYSPGKLDNAIALTINTESHGSHPGSNALELRGSSQRDKNARINAILGPIYLEFQSKSLLHIAARRGKVEHLKRLLDIGSDPNELSRDTNQVTPLMLAVARSTTAFTELLLNKGADVNAKDKHEMSPLHYAAVNGRSKTILLLIEAGCGVSDVNDRGMTSLHFAAQNGHTKTVAILIEHGADVHSRSSSGHTPLMLATTKGNYETVEFLLAQGGSVHTTDPMGFTALHLAADKGYTNLVHLLIRRGSNVDARASGKTPLFQSSFKNHRETTELLLRYGSDVNAHDIFGRTALHYAALEGQVAMVKLVD